MNNQASSRSNAQSNNQSISNLSSRFSPQQTTPSSSYNNMSPSGATTAGSQNLSYSNQARGMPTSTYNPTSSHQQQYSHQQQQQQATTYQQQRSQQNFSQQQQQQQQNAQSSLQQQRAPYRPPTITSSVPSYQSTSQPIMSPNQIQPVSMRPPIQQTNDQRGQQMQQQMQLRYANNMTNQHQQPTPDYPRNVPVMALQQQKVRKLYHPHWLCYPKKLSPDKFPTGLVMSKCIIILL